MIYYIKLVVLSFLASFGFAIVFQINKRFLFLAGLGGALTRIVYLILMAFIPYRIAYAALAAFFVALYAEIMAHHYRTPATVFMYPTIIPLIPGDLLYYTMGGIVSKNQEMFEENGVKCLLALIGLSIGFVVCSTILVYIRRLRAMK